MNLFLFLKYRTFNNIWFQPVHSDYVHTTIFDVEIIRRVSGAHTEKAQ
jgi:hypothetical protein